MVGCTLIRAIQAIRITIASVFINCNCVGPHHSYFINFKKTKLNKVSRNITLFFFFLVFLCARGRFYVSVRVLTISDRRLSPI